MTAEQLLRQILLHIARTNDGHYGASECEAIVGFACEILGLTEEDEQKLFSTFDDQECDLDYDGVTAEESIEVVVAYLKQTEFFN